MFEPDGSTGICGSDHRNSAMRWRTTIALGLLGATVAVPDFAQAQFSPQGLIGGMTRPFRQMFGHLGHYPRSHRHHTATTGSQAAAAAPSNSEQRADTASRLGWAGPPAWASAYEDVLGFTFWPDDYAARLRGHGFDLIADTISGRFEMPRRGERVATTGVGTGSDAGEEKTRCDDTGTQATWPAARVEQILQLTDSEHDALEKLQSTVVQSMKPIKSDCGASADLSPPDRLGALVQTIWTVRDAGISSRAALKNFYDSLTATQKISFAGRQPQAQAPVEAKDVSPAMNKQYQACAMQNAEKAERLVKEIEMRVRPNKEQAASFENFHKVSSEMAKLLIASCAQPIPADPMARLDNANDQLTAINYAATTVQIAFNDFYARLDSAQKTRFDALAR
jgi:LTXXQ motif family protein